MSLNVVVRTPISSVDSTASVSSKSPVAMRSAPSVSFSMGSIMVLASRNDKSTETRRPTSSACRMMNSSSEFSDETVVRLSRM